MAPKLGYTPKALPIRSFNTMINRIGRGVVRDFDVGAYMTVVCTFPYNGPTEDQLLAMEEEAEMRAEEEAAEFIVPKIPTDRWSMWSKFQELKIDLVIQENKMRKKSILLADMDSTIIQQECIDELASEIGIGERVKFITAEAMNGKLDFEEALTERVALLKGLSTQIIDKVLKERITFMPGASTLLSTMKSNGCYSALVSGGFTLFTEKVLPFWSGLEQM